jgi:hypothetical protein
MKTFDQRIEETNLETLDEDVAFYFAQLSKHGLGDIFAIAPVTFGILSGNIEGELFEKHELEDEFLGENEYTRLEKLAIAWSILKDKEEGIEAPNLLA